MTEENKLFKEFKQLSGLLDFYAGGSVSFGDLMFFEDIKTKMSTLYHCKKFKGYKLMVVLVKTDL